MSSTTIGEVMSWSELRPSKFHNFNRGLQLDSTWYNFYNKDANYLNNLHVLYPAGTRVKIEYDETKGYMPVSKIEKTTEQIQQTLTGTPAVPVISPARADRSEGMLRSVALKAAVDFYKDKAFMFEKDANDVTAVVTQLAEQLLKWLR